MNKVFPVTSYKIADDEILASLSQYTLPQILLKQAERLGSEETAIREKAYGIWQTYNWQDYYRYVKRNRPRLKRQRT